MKVKRRQRKGRNISNLSPSIHLPQLDSSHKDFSLASTPFPSLYSAQLAYHPNAGPTHLPADTRATTRDRRSYHGAAQHDVRGAAPLRERGVPTPTA